MDNEVWKDIEDNDTYEVSSFGNVRNKRTNKILKAGKNSKGYMSVSLTSNGKASSKDVHRLVAIAFCDNPNDYKSVDHKNCSKVDNHYTNLRWCTSSQNSMNIKKRQNTSSKYKGVYYNKQNYKYVASIRINGKLKVLGSFADEKEAGQRYNREAQRLFGEFAKLNDISDSDSDSDSESSDSESDSDDE